MSPSVRVTVWKMIRITSKTGGCLSDIVDVTAVRYLMSRVLFDLNSVRSKIFNSRKNNRRDAPPRASTSVRGGLAVAIHPTRI
jgi:hypothetical protein